MIPLRLHLLRLFPLLFGHNTAHRYGGIRWLTPSMHYGHVEAIGAARSPGAHRG